MWCSDGQTSERDGGRHQNDREARSQNPTESTASRYFSGLRDGSSLATAKNSSAEAKHDHKKNFASGKAVMAAIENSDPHEEKAGGESETDSCCKRC